MDYFRTNRQSCKVTENLRIVYVSPSLIILILHINIIQTVAEIRLALKFNRELTILEDEGQTV